MRLLLVEDSPRLQELVAETLRESGYGVDVAGTVADFLSSATSIAYAVIIVDLGLPDGDGLTAIRELRSRGASMPILIITARSAIEDRVAGLDAGADDFLIKPFNHHELLARVRALRRRPSEAASAGFLLGKLAVNATTGEASWDGRVFELRHSEWRLLMALLQRHGSPVPKALLEDLQGRSVSSNAVEAVVSRLRKALADAGTDMEVVTVRGIGYALRART